MSPPNLKNSFGGGIPLLFALYMLQGLPFGLVTGSLPLILSNTVESLTSGGGDYRGASWLAITTLPYGFKLFWAPLIDTSFSKFIGKRRSWIIPCNILACLLWVDLGLNIDELVDKVIDPSSSSSSSSSVLSIIFGDQQALFLITSRLFFIILIMAISDVAVDGWALTVHKKYYASASLAQTLGMTLGNFVTNAGVVCGRTLSCHQLMFQSNQPIQLTYFCLFASFLHFIVTLYVMLYVKEDHVNERKMILQEEEEEEEKKNTTEPKTVKEVIQLIYAMSQRKHCRTLALLLLTSKFAFALSENGVFPSIEYVHSGGDMEKLAIVIAFQYPCQGLIGLYVSKYLGSRGGHSIDLWKRSHFYLLFLSGIIPLFIFVVSYLISNQYEWTGAIVLGIVLSMNNIVNKVLFIAMGTWFNQISDEAAGGTIVTFLNSLSNIGRFFPRAPAFWLVGQIGPTQSVGVLVIAGIAQYPFLSRWMRELKKVNRTDWQIKPKEEREEEGSSV